MRAMMRRARFSLPLLFAAAVSGAAHAAAPIPPEVLEQAQREGSAPVNDVRQALTDEQVLAREMIVEVDHPEFGTLREVRSPIRTEGEIRNPPRAPKLGEHTDAILAEVLRYTPSAIQRLREDGVIA